MTLRPDAKALLEDVNFCEQHGVAASVPAQRARPVVESQKLDQDDLLVIVNEQGPRPIVEDLIGALEQALDDARVTLGQDSIEYRTAAKAWEKDIELLNSIVKKLSVI